VVRLDIVWTTRIQRPYSGYPIKIAIDDVIQEFGSFLGGKIRGSDRFKPYREVLKGRIHD
jgi:hypothetical protein